MIGYGRLVLLIIVAAGLDYCKLLWEPILDPYNDASSSKVAQLGPPQCDPTTMWSRSPRSRPTTTWSGLPCNHVTFRKVYLSQCGQGSPCGLTQCGPTTLWSGSSCEPREASDAHTK